MDVQPLQTSVGARRGGPDSECDDSGLVLARKNPMNFDCVRWRTQDELWEMTVDECKDEEDDGSLVLSSRAKTAPKYKQRAPQDVG
jgi:hypothetical protein